MLGCGKVQKGPQVRDGEQVAFIVQPVQEHSSATVDQQFALVYFDISEGFPHHCLGWVCPASISI